MGDRRCLVSGESTDPDVMVRYVVDPDGVVIPDLAGTLPGRGLWVRADALMVETAVRKGLFAKAAKRSIRCPDDLAQQTQTLLARQIVDLLGLARRAGQAVSGFEKVRERLKGGEVVLLLSASDGALDGRRKLSALAEATDVAVIELLTVAELSFALGRENVVHAALAPGGLARRLKTECKRLAGFRQIRTP